MKDEKGTGQKAEGKDSAAVRTTFPPLVRRERPMFLLNWKTFPGPGGLAIAERLLALICRRRIYEPQFLLDDLMEKDALGSLWGLARRDQSAFKSAQKKAMAAYPEEFAHWLHKYGGGPLGEIPSYRVLDNLQSIGVVIEEERSAGFRDFVRPGPLYKLFDLTLPPEFEAMWKAVKTYVADEAKRRFEYSLQSETRPSKPAADEVDPSEPQPGAAVPHSETNDQQPKTNDPAPEARHP